VKDVTQSETDAVRARDGTASSAADLVAGLSLEEKASLCSGADFWHTKGVTRVGIPSLTLTDGPHGVRLAAGAHDRPGLDDAVPATCFPTASALAATWDPDLIEEVGIALGQECLALGVDVLLGPGVNLKRDPRCGRNFEYFSEDPLLAGRMAAALIRGVQSRGVGTSLKHLAGNDQEAWRMVVDSVYDERSLRELELAAFELPVREAQPLTVMCAYNRLNGEHAAANGWLLTRVLREEWGFRGIVVTDWGAMTDRVAALAAGCELEMPGTADPSDRSVVEAVRTGELAEAMLDATATRLVQLALATSAARDAEATFDVDAHHELARRVAAAAVVLCRNVDDALPLREGERVALVGAFAEQPRYQGTGSSKMHPTRLEDLRTELGLLLAPDALSYAPGYDRPDIVDDALVADAVALTGDADVVIVCIGLPQGYENEGDDRRHLRLPRSHDALVAALAAAHDRVVVVLSNGAPVELPWADDVEAIVEGYLGGQAGAGGLADVLTGGDDPAGRLGETFPVHLDDLPTARSFPGGPRTAEHREGLYVGYRYHDSACTQVRFPFGHGLSYTSFAYGDVALSTQAISPAALAAGGTVTVEVEVTNTGDRDGKEVVQVYVRDLESAVHRPDRELRGFAKVHLASGAAQTVAIDLGERAFAFWDVERSGWTVEPGEFEVLVGSSSRDTRGTAVLRVEGEPLPRREEPAVYRTPPRHLDVDAVSYAVLLGRPLPPGEPFSRPFTVETPFAAVTDTPAGRLLLAAVRRQARTMLGAEASGGALAAAVDQSPLRTLRMYGLSSAQLMALLDVLNGRWTSAAVAALRGIVGRLRR
jgi:beta-glucosidase